MAARQRVIINEEFHEKLHKIVDFINEQRFENFHQLRGVLFKIITSINLQAGLAEGDGNIEYYRPFESNNSL